MSKFETVKEGPNAGQLVSLYYTMGAPSVRKTAPPHNRSRTGYGAKIPTQYMVRTIDQTWRRVYCMIYSNSGTCYVMHGKVRTIVDISED
jgi:hypothetical protein